MIVERVNLSTTQPFDYLAVKDHCRVDFHDFELDRMASAAAAELEAYAQIALLDQTIRLTLDGWGRCSRLALPIAPLVDPLSVTITADGAPFEAFAVVAGLRPVVRLTGCKPTGVVVIEYEAGFGCAHTDIPSDLALAIMDQSAAWYDARGAGDGKSERLSPHFARIAARYRRVAL